MAEFYVSLSEREMARQIAAMINAHNRWYTRFNEAAMLSMQGRYFVEIYGGKVAACAGTVEDQPSMTKIQHVCVLPEFRRRGLSKKLVELSMMHSRTEYIYMTVREDNIPSLAMARSLGFTFIRKDWFRDHYTQTLARRRVQ